MARYVVGQVIYVVLKKNRTVVPMQIIEEITKKTLQGSLVTYQVMAGTDPKNSILIEQVDGEIFESAEAARKALIERASASIDKIIKGAQAQARTWYVNQANPPEFIPQLSEEGHDQALVDSFANVVEESDGQMIQMPDGTMARARVRLPSSMQG